MKRLACLLTSSREVVRWAFVLIAVGATAAGAAPEQLAPKAPKSKREGAARVWAAAPSAPVDRASKAGAAPVAAAQKGTAQAAADDLHRLGDLKTLKVGDGEALVVIEGVQQTIRPGMRTKLGLVESVSPQRLVLLRTAAEDPKKGDTRVIVDLLGGGRNRVRIYASRDWTVERPRPAE